MRRLIFIFLALSLSACVRINISEDSSPMARYVSIVDWGLAQGVQPTAADTTTPLYIALARTTQTVHDTCHLFLPQCDTHTVAKGNYHAIAFGGSLTTFYRVDNYERFQALPKMVGLADISLLLPAAPESSSTSSAAASGEQLTEAEKAEEACLEYLRQGAPFPVVQEAQPVWMASDHRNLESGEVINQLQFKMQKMIQELTLRIRIDYDETQLTIDGLALALNGVPRRLNVLSGSVHQGETLSSSSDKSDIGSLLAKLTLTSTSGNTHFYECTFKTLGLFSPASEAETGGWGVVDIAVKIRDKNIKSRKINLFRLLKDHPVMSELGSAGDYRISRSAAVLDISSYALLTISPSTELEDEAALQVWIEEGDDHHIPIVPEDV